MNRTRRNLKTTYANGMLDRTKDYGPAAMYVKLSLRNKSDTFLCQNSYQSFQSVSRASLSGVVLPTATLEAYGVIHRVRMFRGLYGTALFSLPQSLRRSVPLLVVRLLGPPLKPPPLHHQQGSSSHGWGTGRAGSIAKTPHFGMP